MRGGEVEGGEEDLDEEVIEGEGNMGAKEGM